MKPLTLLLFAVFMALIAAAPNAGALSTVELEVLPGTLSPDSPFIMIAKPGTGYTNVRINWETLTTGNEIENMGLFPKVGSKYICEFPDTCGPSPFKSSGINTIRIFIIDSENPDLIGRDPDLTKDITVGGVGVIKTDTVSDESDPKKVTVAVRSLEATSATLSVYDSEMILISKDLAMVQKDPLTPQFEASVTVSKDGDYYAVIDLKDTQNDKSGGTAERFTVGGAAGTGYNVYGEVDYQIYLTQGKESDRITDYVLKNDGSTAVSDLSVAIPEELQNNLEIELEDSTIPAGGSTTFDVVLKNVKAGMDINTDLDVLSGQSVVGSIKLKLGVTVMGTSAGVVTTLQVVGSTVFNFGLIAGGEKTLGLSIKNNGAETITDLKYRVEPASVESMIGLDGLPASILPAESKDFTLSVKTTGSTPPQLYTGIVTIYSGNIEEDIALSIDVFPDVRSHISTLESKMNELTEEDRKTYAGAVTEIERLIGLANDYMNSGDYESALISYQQASAVHDAVLEMKEGGGGGFEINADLVLIGAAIAAVAGVLFVVYWFFSKRKGRGEEEEYADEFEEEPEEGEEEGEGGELEEEF